MDRAIVYPRVSSVGQVDGVSLSDQERHGLEYCAQRGYEVVAVIQDVSAAMTHWTGDQGYSRYVTCYTGSRLRLSSYGGWIGWRLNRQTCCYCIAR